MQVVQGRIDLHTHSSCSDGALSVAALVERARERGIRIMALTDHDCVLGVSEAFALAEKKSIHLISGSELSTTWNNVQIHVVGLFLDIENAELKEFFSNQRLLRLERAHMIAAKLERQGFARAYERTAAMAGEGANITRGSFARFIFSVGQATSIDDAFNSYLKKGKCAYVKTNWPDIAEAVRIIKGAGGIAVLAHPKRYELTNMKLRALIEYFKACGGEAMEVAGCSQSMGERNYLADLSCKYELYASLGSDFHTISPWRDLGMGLALPASVTPVWLCEQGKKYDLARILEVADGDVGSK